jgi:hypothetical protein
MKRSKNGRGTTVLGHTPVPRRKILSAYQAGPEAITSLIQYLEQVETLSQQVKQLLEQSRQQVSEQQQTSLRR